MLKEKGFENVKLSTNISNSFKNKSFKVMRYKDDGTLFLGKGHFTKSGSGIVFEANKTISKGTKVYIFPEG